MYCEENNDEFSQYFNTRPARSKFKAISSIDVNYNEAVSTFYLATSSHRPFLQKMALCSYFLYGAVRFFVSRPKLGRGFRMVFNPLEIAIRKMKTVNYSTVCVYGFILLVVQQLF